MLDEAARLAIRQRLKDDFPHYAAKCLYIRTKSGSVKPLEMNKAQRYMHERLEEQLKNTGRVRALILKGRQQGCSTYVEARFFWKVTHRRGVRAFILTHLDEATQNIFNIVSRYYENAPPPVRPLAGTANAKELVFSRLDSSYRVSTAKSKGTGRSDTLQYFHGSEVAYWANAEEHVSGVLQAIPDAPGTEIILESTSAGAQGLFYEMCMAAKAGESAYQLIFVPWYWQPEYRKATPEGFACTPDEEQDKAEYGLDDEQIYWRRMKVSELGGISAFQREYPFTVEQAFQTEVEGALWKRATLDLHRVRADALPEMKRIVVAIDPASTSKESSDETGIIVAGLGVDNQGYILADLSGRYTPHEWATKAVNAYHTFEADRIVAETNQGGEMVEFTIRSVDSKVAYKTVVATKGKRTRAEPVAALDEQGRIHHVGRFEKLEDQLTSWDASGNDESPDRLDARVWAIYELMLGRKSEGPKVWVA